MKHLNWNCKKFSELGTTELYSILRLRSEVFIVEQKCVYQDLDDSDQPALHVMAFLDDELVAYARALPPGIKYESSSIGRVVTSSKIRRDGYGKVLVEKVIASCRENWPQHDITISAQHYLESFYKSFGFITESEPYLEDDIPHVLMRLPNTD